MRDNTSGYSDDDEFEWAMRCAGRGAGEAPMSTQRQSQPTGADIERRVSDCERVVTAVVGATRDTMSLIDEKFDAADKKTEKLINGTAEALTLLVYAVGTDAANRYGFLLDMTRGLHGDAFSRALADAVRCFDVYNETDDDDDEE
jgi:hypothetical protein